MLAVARTVDAVGWAGAADLLDAEFRGWECDVLADAVPWALRAWDDADRRADRAWLARLLGARR